jgi:hypothetical protein
MPNTALAERTNQSYFSWLFLFCSLYHSLLLRAPYPLLAVVAKEALPAKEKRLDVAAVSEARLVYGAAGAAAPRAAAVTRPFAVVKVNA